MALVLQSPVTESPLSRFTGKLDYPDWPICVRDPPLSNTSATCFNDTSRQIQVQRTTEQSNFDSATWFQKIRKLVDVEFQDHCEEKLMITEIDGANSEREFSVSVQKTAECTPNEYTIRIPIYTTVGLDYRVTTLLFVAQTLQVCGPVFEAYTMSNDNPLGQGYLIQSRLTGQPLAELWDSISIGQKQSVARQVTQLVDDCHKITSRYAGILSSKNTYLDFKDRVQVEQFPVPALGASKSMAKQQPMLDTMLELCDRWYGYEVATRGQGEDFICGSFKAMAKKLYELDILSDETTFHLHHPNLNKQTIYAKIRENEIKVTGCLDWDKAFFAPRFACSSLPNDLLEHENAAEFRQSLDRSKCAVARRMFRLLRQGLNDLKDIEEATNIISDFGKSYPLV